MPRGSKPGERRGGRQPGTPNKASIARQEQVKASGATPLDVMLEAMRYLRGRAAQELAKTELVEGQAKPAINHKLVRQYLMDAAKIAADCAKFVHPALASTTMKGDPEKPVTHKLEIEFV